MVFALAPAGWDDPAESAAGTLEGHLLELKEQALLDAEQQFLDWFDALPERPDVVLVHRHSLAHALLERLAANGGEPVLILTGHDHYQHVESEGAHVLVDGGTVGAGGAFGVGEDPSGFALVHLDADDRARAVAPAGSATSRRCQADAPRYAARTAGSSSRRFASPESVIAPDSMT